MNIRREQSDYAPHACTECGEAAYIPFHGMARCTNWQCNRFDHKIWEEHVMSLPDTGDPLDDEPTNPGFSLTDELLKLHAEIEKAIDTMPVPCYTVDKKSLWKSVSTTGSTEDMSPSIAIMKRLLNGTP